MMKRLLPFLTALLAATLCAGPQAMLLGVKTPVATGAPTPDLLWWKLNAGTGTTALTPEVGGAFSHNADWVTGKSGSGYALDFTAANTDHAQSDAGVTYGSVTGITVCLWVYLDSTASSMLVESGPSMTSFANTYWLYLDGSGNLNIGINGESGYNTRYTGAPSTGAWVHIAATYNFTNGTAQLYYDGVSQSLTNDTMAYTGSWAAGNWALNVGARNAGASLPIDGKVDDVRIYGSILSGANITAVKNDPQ